MCIIHQGITSIYIQVESEIKKIYMFRYNVSHVYMKVYMFRYNISHVYIQV